MRSRPNALKDVVVAAATSVNPGELDNVLICTAFVPETGAARPGSCENPIEPWRLT